MDGQKIIESLEFKNNISEKLIEIDMYRDKILGKLPRGTRLKSSEYSYLKEHKLWNPDLLAKECELLINKKSELPARIRLYLEDIFIFAIRKTIEQLKSVQ